MWANEKLTVPMSHHNWVVDPVHIIVFVSNTFILEENV